MNTEHVTLKARELCEKNDAKLIYLCLFGSHLYGTNSPESDLDVKGIFLPSLESLVLGKAPKHLHYSTGDKHSKNSAEDIDIELFSLQYWLDHLVRKGETIGLDLLFSWTNKECVLPVVDNQRWRIHDYTMIHVFNAVDQLLTSSDLLQCAYVKYAIGQAKKYGIKGSRLGVLKRIESWINVNFDDDKNHWKTIKLANYIDEIIKYFGDESFCFDKDINGVRSLVVCGKVHMATISVFEFFERIRGQYKTYGERARLAEENQGIDWKACSHALRAIFQTEELLTTGKITFPLARSGELLEVKQGRLPWSEVEKLITDGLQHLETIESDFVGKWNQAFVNNEILGAYNLQEVRDE